MTYTASAIGKIILCGEYAVVFGHPGIAVPAGFCVEVTYEPGDKDENIAWEGVTENRAKADAYVKKVLDACALQGEIQPGALHIKNTIPLGKGMGSSTALTIAIARCVFAHAAESRDSPLLTTGGFPLRDKILAVENIVNPGSSGIDFAVMWEERPVYFKKGWPTKPMELSPVITEALKNAVFIDTGTPNEATPELVTWILSKHIAGEPHIEQAIHAIGACAGRLQHGEDFATVIRDHHRAQVMLGIVNSKTKKLIKKIEQSGGAAKVIGAGGRTGGSGVVIAFHTDPKIAEAMGFEAWRMEN